MPKYIQRFAVKMNEENLQEIIEFGARLELVTSDFAVTMELNAEDGLETYFVIEKHSDENSLRYYQIDSDEFDSKFVFYNGAIRYASTNVTLQEIKPL